MQKFHSKPVPRIGGLAILLSLLTILIANKLPGLDYLLMAALPIFVIGTIEDITKQISAKMRLFISFISAALVYFLLHIHFQRLDWGWLDHWVQLWPAFSFIVTLLFIGGLIHAMNLIDGFNGLMLGVSLMMIAAIVLVSYWVNDALVFSLSLACLGAVGGLFVVNFPLGKIFAGDSGAYLIGFLLGTLTLMLVQRNPAVSAWFPYLLMGYPIFETLFSIYRKAILRKRNMMQPDGVHLHMLFYKRIRRHKDLNHEAINNAMTSPYLWLLSLVGILPALFFWDKTLYILIFGFIFMIVYLRIYWYFVLFKDQGGLFRFFNIKKLVNKAS